MTEQETEFMRELRQLLRRHMVRLKSHTDYDGEDNACGNQFTLEGPSIDLDVSTVEEELKQP